MHNAASEVSDADTGVAAICELSGVLAAEFTIGKRWSSESAMKALNPLPRPVHQTNSRRPRR